MRKRRGAGRWTIIFLCCTLAVPTVAWIMGFYGDAAPTLNAMRPALRLLSAPIGCLTLGLFGLVIDVGLLYGCGALVEGFAVPSLLYAVLTAALINGVCAVAAGRR